MKPRILVTAGDPLGIGPEVTVKALRAGRVQGLLEAVVIGEKSSLERAGWHGGLGRLIPLDDPSFRRRRPGPDKAAGLLSYLSLRLALSLIREGRFGALVTAPVCKESWALAGAPHTGHTEALASFDGSEPLMAFTDGKLNCALLTEHLPLSGVAGALSEGLVARKARLFAAALRRLGRPGPVSLCALNPHAGDGGKLGREEKDVLFPAARKLRARGVRITDPLPAEIAWKSHLEGRAAGVLAAYHDQGLAHMKLLGDPRRTVHWTFGLSFIRTSPPHGTAFDIAGKGAADPAGMTAALLFAARLASEKKK